ncbi:MAG: DUF2442 domain-containing protein [Planctomycetes bacterium]|nr:DUF2442 domain-containing protein [Planctomycetota bacterium]
MLDRLRIIREVHPQRPARLRLTYDDGQTITVDFGPVIQGGGVFTPLADWDVFSRAQPDSRGRSVCWPGDIDFCADALWLQAQQDDQRLGAPPLPGVGD